MNRKAPLSSVWRLSASSWREFRKHWLIYVLVVAVVAIPVNALTYLDSVIASNGVFNAYGTLATVFMSVAIIYAIAAALEGRRVPSLREIYYDSSAAVLRFILSSLWLLLILSPAALGVITFYLAMNSVPGTVPSLGEVSLFGLLALLCASPSIWMVGRFGFGTYAVVQDGMAPLPALGYSWRLTQGRFWRILGRFAFLLVAWLIVSVLVPEILVVSTTAKSAVLIAGFYQIVLGFVTLPMVNIYLMLLYRELKVLQETA